MVRCRRPSSQGWKTFLRNHLGDFASLDLFIVRTISFKLLDGLVSCVTLETARHDCCNCQSKCQWIAGQVSDAFPWKEAPTLLIRDRDEAFGLAYSQCIRATRIRDHPTRHTRRRRTATLSL